MHLTTGRILLRVHVNSQKLVLNIVLEYCRYVEFTWIYEQRNEKYFTYHYAWQQNGNHIFFYPSKILHICLEGMNLTHTCDIYPYRPRRKEDFRRAICYTVTFCQPRFQTSSSYSDSANWPGDEVIVCTPR